MQHLLLQGASVWVPDVAMVWAPAQVVRPLSNGQLGVEREGQEEETLLISSPNDLPPLRNPEILVGANDLTSLSYLHEPAGEGPISE